MLCQADPVVALQVKNISIKYMNTYSVHNQIITNQIIAIDTIVIEFDASEYAGCRLNGGCSVIYNGYEGQTTMRCTLSNVELAYNQYSSIGYGNSEYFVFYFKYDSNTFYISCKFTIVQSGDIIISDSNNVIL